MAVRRALVFDTSGGFQLAVRLSPLRHPRAARSGAETSARPSSLNRTIYLALPSKNFQQKKRNFVNRLKDAKIE